MEDKIKGINTICTHVGEIEDKQFGGAVSPIYPSTSMHILMLRLADILDILILQIKSICVRKLPH